MRTTKLLISVVSLFVLLALTALPLNAQIITGQIQGTITDEQGAVVPGAKVVALDLASTKTYDTTTNNNGGYSITNVQFGFYKLTVSASKFSTKVVDRVQVQVSQTAIVNLKLSLGAETTVIEVKDGQTDIQTETAEVKNTVDRRQLMDLPLPTRNPLDLVWTMPGQTKVFSSTSDNFVHGLRPSATDITQDGINVADNFVKTSSFFAITSPTVEGTGEFSVSTAGQGTDGGYGAAQVSLTTKRGENKYHGGAFWYQRNSFLNANTFFNNSAGLLTPFQLQNRIGYNIGGPVWIPHIYDGRKKTFFFNSLEVFREPKSQGVTDAVMTASALAGNYTYNRVDTGASNTISLFSLPNIPFLATNAASVNFYTHFVPLPNSTSGCGGDVNNISCFRFNLGGKNAQNRYVARLDHNITANESIEADFNQSNFLTAQDFLNGITSPFPGAPGGGQASKRQVWSFALHSIFGSTKTNELRFGIQRAPVTFVLGSDYSLSNGYALSYPGILTNPELISRGVPQGRNTRVWELIDNFSWVMHGHNVRVGGDFRRIWARSFQDVDVTPFMQLGNSGNTSTNLTTGSFPGGISSTQLTNANTVYQSLTGMVSQILKGFAYTSNTSGFSSAQQVYQPQENFLSFYAQDQFKLRSNLTINYGVRWEYQGPFRDLNNLVLGVQNGLTGLFGSAGVNNFVTPQGSNGGAVADTLLIPYNVAGAPPMTVPDYNNFAPFAGFAWDPFKNGKTSVRGGYGIHFIEDGLTALTPSITGQTGYFSDLSNSNISNPLGSCVTPSAGNVCPVQYAIGTQPTIATPANLVFPTSMLALYNATPSTLASANFFKPNLATPYVMEWNFSISRELPKRFTLEARYVGNHSVKLWRSVNMNQQINVLSNPYSQANVALCNPASAPNGCAVANLLTEFLNAQNNLAICTANRVACTGAANGTLTFANKGLAGQLNLPIFQSLFGGPAASSFTNATFVGNLQNNALFTMLSSLRTNNVTTGSAPIKTNRLANFTPNFFVPNQGLSAANYVNNDSWSTYHGLETELRRRFSNGLFMVVNYTWSKSLTDVRAASSQNEGQIYQDITNPKLDKYRAAFDVRHNINANVLYPLPFGKGQRWMGGVNSWANIIVGGWSIQGITHFQTGAPFTMSSGFATSNANLTEPLQINNMTAAQLASNLGIFKTATGVYYLNPASGLFTITGTSFGTRTDPVICTTGQTTPCFSRPAPMSYGNTSFNQFSGPGFIGQDLSIIKRTNVPHLGEGTNVELRLEAFNAFNHANFVTPGTFSLTSTTFAQLTSTADSIRGGGVPTRVLQWAIRFNF